MLDKYLTNVITNDIPINLNIIDIKRFNNYLTLLRTTALVMRFIRNLRKKKTKEDLRFSTLDSTKIEAALKIWIQYTRLSASKPALCTKANFTGYTFFFVQINK